jgi:DNA-binding transcriptional ArsR family regulator
LAECRTVEWQHAVGEQMGLNYPAFYRGLKVLEGAGLVAVDRHNGRSPIVTIVGPKQ